MNSQTYDAAVVGGGIIGASTAFRLGRAGLRVLLLEAGAVAGGTSDNSFAWVNSVSKRPDAYHRLNAAGIADYALIEEVPGVEVHRTGSLHAPVLPGEEDELDKRRERLNSLDYRARWISRDEAMELEPHLHIPESSQRILFFDDDAWVDPPQIIRALLAAAGGSLEVREHTPVEGIDHEGSYVTGIRAGGESIAVGAVVLCAGIGTDSLTESLGVSLPLQRKPGLLVVTSPVPEGTLQRVIHYAMAREISCHLRPDITGGIRIGSDQYDEPMREDTVMDPPPQAARHLLRRAIGVLPPLEGSLIARAHLGVRPVPADGVSVAGQLPGYENAYVAVTHSGVTMGPLLGRLIATQLTDATADPLLEAFRPERFALAH